MAISMYGASTPIFLRMLDNLDHCSKRPRRMRPPKASIR